MATITNWMYVALVSVFVLGLFIGMAIGRRKGMADMLLKQQQLEATRMWTESLSKYMGGKNGIS